MSDIMLDLETLSVRPDAAILVIGAIRFTRGQEWPEQITENQLNNLDIFYKRIDIKSCKKYNLRIDPQTQAWWNEQSDDVKYEALYNTDRVPLIYALKEFKKWVGNNSYTKIWGNGSFDCTILGEAYKKCNLEIPWKFWMERDLRTYMDIANIKLSDFPQMKKHHALFDCYRQILAFQKSEKKININ